MGKNDSVFVLNHEVKTALNGIIGYTQLLLKTPLDKKQKGYIENINIYSIKLLHNINNILDYHRLLTGNITNNIEMVDVLVIINEIAMMINNSLKNIKFNYTIQSIIPQIKVDKNKLIQTILNLVLSLMEFNDNTFININLSNKNDNILFEITSDIKTNNDSFKKILTVEFDNICNEIYENNVNIDLCICKMISLHLKWSLGFKFTQACRTYYLNIPILEYNNKIDIKVLIADDNINSIHLLKEIIFENIDENNVTIVFDGGDVIKELEKGSFDVLFLDMNMPVTDGTIVLKYIADNNIAVDTYVISACDYSDFLEKHDYCIKQYITKPYNIDQIKNIIMKYINK